MERRVREVGRLFPCDDCQFYKECLFEHEPFKDLVIDEKIFYCGDLFFLYKRFQEISQKIKQTKENECGEI